MQGTIDTFKEAFSTANVNVGFLERRTQIFKWIWRKNFLGGRHSARIVALLHHGPAAGRFRETRGLSGPPKAPPEVPLAGPYVWILALTSAIRRKGQNFPKFVNRLFSPPECIA